MIYILKGVKIMNDINYDFDVPYYIFEEIIEYISLAADSYEKTSKWNNIQMLLNTAVVNNRLSYEQVEYLKNKFKNL